MKLSGEFEQIMGVYYCPFGNSAYIACASFDKTVKLWDSNLGSKPKVLKGHDAAVNNVAYSYDGKFIASGSDDKTIILWEPHQENNSPSKILKGHDEPVLTVLFTFDSKKLISSDQSGIVIVWDLATGDIIRKFKAHTSLVQDLSVAGDNKTIVTVSLDKKVKLWDISTGENLMEFDAGVKIWSVDITSDAEIIILGCGDGTVRFLERKGN